MRKKIMGLILLLSIAYLLSGCRDRPAIVPEQPLPAFTPLKVVASFYPVAFLAEQVGEDRVQVVSMVPPGTEAHHFEPTARQIVMLKEADLFVYNGAGMEPWADRLVQNPENPRLIIVKASTGIELLKHEGKDFHEHDKGHRHADHHYHGEYDPHIWLDPLLAKKMAANIAAGFKQADPDGVSTYQKNLAVLHKRLDELHSRYQEALQGKAGQPIVTSHAAFGYLAHRYGLVQVPIMGLSPKAEPSPARMARLVRMVRETGVKYVFSETLANPRIAETLAKEVGAEVLILNPIEGLTIEQDIAEEDYFTIMEQNLVNLKQGLGVQD